MTGLHHISDTKAEEVKEGIDSDEPTIFREAIVLDF